MSNKLNIKVGKIPEEIFPKTSSDYGYFYEDILKKKSLRYIDGLKSIYDPGIFYKNGRNLKAIKALIIKGKTYEQIIDNYKEAVNLNDFIIFPQLVYGFDFFVNEQKYELEFTKAGKIFVNRYNPKNNKKEATQFFYGQGTTIYFEHENEHYYYSQFQIEEKDPWQIYLLTEDKKNKESIFMIVFKIELEIDGFFLAEKQIDLDNYKAEEYDYCNKKIEKIIDKEKNIIYEVKSGSNFSSLANQIIRDYYFFEKLFDVYRRYDIKKFMIFGFLRTNNNRLKDLKKTQDYEALRKIPIPVVIFRYEDKLFGENVLFESVEINEINELKYLVKNNSEKIGNLENKVDNLEKKVDNLEKKVDNLEKKFDGMNQILLEIKASIQNNQSQNNGQNNQPSMNPQQFPHSFNQNMYPSFNNGLFFVPMPVQFIQNPNFSKDEELSKKKEDK